MGVNMRDLFYQELYKQNKAVKELEHVWNNEKNEEGKGCLVDALLKIAELSNVARKEGLLALESMAFRLEDAMGYQYLKMMITLVVDGMEPEIIEEMCTAKYFATGLEAYEALQYMIFMYGTLSIQQGENPYIIEQKMLTLVSESITELYHRKLVEVEREKQQPKEADLSVMEKYYIGDVAVEYGDEAYFLVKVIDYIIKTIDDRSIQRVLRDVDNNDVAIMMCGVSGDARKRIFSNMSERLGIMIAQNMDFMGPIKVKDVSDATNKVFSIITRLISYGEIGGAENELIKVLAKIVGIREMDAHKKVELRMAESELQKLINELEGQSNRMIYPNI